MAQFTDLPTELRLKIFEYVVNRRKRRVIEITERNGTIISKTPPPPLLHVNQLARYVVLKTCKPWLSQFKGTRAHQPWAVFANKSKLSALDNVCIDLERDTLLIKNDIQIIRLFRPLEKQFLRRMALEEVGSYRLAEEATQFLGMIKNLKILCIHNDGATPDETKGFILKRCNYWWWCDDQRPKRLIPDYIAPKVLCWKLTARQYSRRRAWTTYKYPAGYRWAKEPEVVPISFGEDSHDQELNVSSRKRSMDVSCDETHDRTDRPSKRKRRLQPKKKQNGYINNGVDSEHNSPDPTICPPQERHTLSSMPRRVPALPIHSLEVSAVSTHGSSIQKSVPPEYQTAWKTEGRKQPPITSPPAKAKTSTQGDKPLFLKAQAHPLPSADLSEEEEEQQQTPRTEYTPAKFMAERTVDNSNNREILVRWTDFPNEEDWTWESETTLQEDVPDMMKAWNTRKTKEKEGTCILARGDNETETEREEDVPIYEVEAILGKKKIKGLVHYLVQWKGYRLMKDRTWEVRERLRIDVPEMVDLFERRWRKRV